MKNLLLIALFFFSYTSFSQSIPSPFEFRLVDSTNANKSQLYVRARAWVANTFASAKDVIQMDDKDAGKIIVKAILSEYPVKNLYGITLCLSSNYATITIDVKDNKYRIVLSDFYNEGCYNEGSKFTDGGSLNNETSAGKKIYRTFSNKKWQDLKEKAAMSANATLASFHNAMSGNAQKSVDDGF